MDADKIDGKHLSEISFEDLAGLLGDAQAPQFLLLDGSRAMTGDLDMDDHDIDLGDGTSAYRHVFGGGAQIKFHPTSSLIYFRNRADTAYAQIYGSAYRFQTMYGISTINIIAPTSNGSQIRFYGYKDEFVDVARLVDDFLEIYRAGNIEFNTGKKLKVGNVSITGTLSNQTKYFPIDDGGVTRYIPMYDNVS